MPERKLGMRDFKLNHLSSLLHESYYPCAGIRFNLAQTATHIIGKSETKLHRVARCDVDAYARGCRTQLSRSGKHRVVLTRTVEFLVHRT